MYNDVFRKNGRDYLRYYESTDSKYREDLLESIEACEDSVARYGADSSVAAAVTHMPLSADVDALPLMVIADSMGGVSLENYAKSLQNERDLALLLTQLHLFIDGPHSRFMKNVDWSINHVFVGVSTQELLIPVLPFAGIVSDMPKMMRFFEFLASQVEVSPARTSQLARDFVRFAIDLSDAQFVDVADYLEDVADGFEDGEDFEFVDYMASTTVLDEEPDEVSQPNATTVLNWDENSALGWNETSIPAGGPGTTVLGMDSDILNGLDDWNPNGYRGGVTQAPSSNEWLPDEKLFGEQATAPAGDTTVLGAVETDLSYGQPQTQTYEYASEQMADVPSDANTAELSDAQDEAPAELPSDKGTTVLADPMASVTDDAPEDMPSDKGTTVLVDPDAEAEVPVDLPSDKGTTVLVDKDAEAEAPADVPSDEGTTVLPNPTDDEDFQAAVAIAAAVYDEGMELPSDQGTTVLEPRAKHAAPGAFDDDFEGNEVDEDSFAPEHAAGYANDKKDKPKKSFFALFGKHASDEDEEAEPELDAQADPETSEEPEAEAEKPEDAEAAVEAELEAEPETDAEPQKDEVAAEAEVPAEDSEGSEKSSLFAGLPFFAKKSSTKDDDASDEADAAEADEPEKDVEPTEATDPEDADEPVEEVAEDTEAADVEAEDDAADAEGAAEEYGTTDDLTEKIPTVLAEEAEPPAPHKIRLVQNSNGRTAIIEPGVRFIVGKSKYSTFQVLNTNTVSRNHAVFTVDDEGRCWIEDDDSRNGTFIDNVQIEPHVPVQVKTGQTIRMSDVMFHIELA